MNKKTTKENRKTINVLGICFCLFILVLMFVILITNASAIGVTPARAVFDYEKNVDKEVTLNVLNDEGKNLKVLVYVDGDKELMQRIELSSTSLEFNPDEREKTFSYSIKIPPLKEPGTHEANIIFREVPQNYGSDIRVEASIAVSSQLHVLVPYPGKYIEEKIDIIDSDGNDPVKFYVGASSKGSEKIEKARVKIEIFTKENEKIDELITNYISILPKERQNFYLEWQPTVSMGEYIAKITIEYDNNSKEIEKIFVIGDERIELLYIFVNDFKLGQIAKFNVLVENKWNQDFNDVYSEILLNDENNINIANSKSAIDVVPALSKKELTSFWDSTNVKPGIYPGFVKIFHNKKTQEHEIEVEIRENELKVRIPGITGKVISSNDGKIDYSFWIILLVSIVAISNLAWWFYLKDKFKQIKYKKQELKTIQDIKTNELGISNLEN